MSGGRNSGGLRICLLAVALLIASLPNGFSQPVSILPGQSIGQTHLGPRGMFYLRKLPKPAANDAGMSQTRQVWVAQKPGGRTDTLFIHTVSNGVLNVRPPDGVTIDLIRVTSPAYHTPSEISTGSTFAQIRSHFPKIRPIDNGRSLYDDLQGGIAFEFAGQARPSSSCVAVMVHPPGDSHTATAQQVNAVLQQGHPR